MLVVLEILFHDPPLLVEYYQRMMLPLLPDKVSISVLLVAQTVAEATRLPAIVGDTIRISTVSAELAQSVLEIVHTKR